MWSIPFLPKPTRGRPPHRERCTVEECLTLDVRTLMRQGILQNQWINYQPHLWLWRSFNEGAVVIEFNYCRMVRHRYPGLDWQAPDIRQVVMLDNTQPNYGGQRWWFKCPCCDQRTATLHLPLERPISPPQEARFACRTCWHLTYQSQLRP